MNSCTAIRQTRAELKISNSELTCAEEVGAAAVSKKKNSIRPRVSGEFQRLLAFKVTGNRRMIQELQADFTFQNPQDLMLRKVYSSEQLPNS